MDEEPTLPQLVRNPNPETFPINPTRKRVRHSSFAALSSDPAIFSSDDDPSADNYLKERSKKKFRGPWYRQVPASEGHSQESEVNEPMKKMDRKFERKYDSGIFLGSDGTDLDEVFEAAALPVRQPWTRQRLQQPEKSPEEKWVEGQIQRCLEDGNETIDLSSRGLWKISGAALRPLSTFTTVPPVSQDVFYRLEPDLKIFLSSNNLRTLPEELFMLERVTALSLRGNTLRELPPAIGNLQHLRELNISLNRLEYLPFEILDLFSETGNLRSFSIHPNPFLQPEFPKVQEPKNEDVERLTANSSPTMASFARSRRGAICFLTPDVRRSWSPQWKVAYQARTDIRYFDKYGVLMKGPSFELRADEVSSKYHFSIPTIDEQLAPEPPSTTEEFTSHAPSLLELSLKACLAQNPQQSQVSSLIEEHAPEHLQNIFDQAASCKESGIEKCTVCKREFIVKRTEWIEWWEISLVQEQNGRSLASMASPLGRMENERDVFESKVPLVRRGCSWFCVPGVPEVVDEDSEEEGMDGTKTV